MYAHNYRQHNIAMMMMIIMGMHLQAAKRQRSSGCHTLCVCVCVWVSVRLSSAHKNKVKKTHHLHTRTHTHREWERGRERDRHPLSCFTLIYVCALFTVWAALESTAWLQRYAVCVCVCVQACACLCLRKFALFELINQESNGKRLAKQAATATTISTINLSYKTSQGNKKDAGWERGRERGRGR